MDANTFPLAQVNWGLYILGSVESGLDYGSCYTSDPITIGIYQEYAYNAYYLLNAIYKFDESSHDFAPSEEKWGKSEAWNLLSERLRTFFLENQTAGDDSGPWTDYWMTSEDVASWRASAKTETNQSMQKYRGRKIWAGAMQGLTSFGDTNEEIKATIFLFTIYHQSPQSALDILRALPPSFTYEDVYNLAINHHIVGQYRNRQDEVKRLIEENAEKIEDDEDPGDYGAAKDFDDAAIGDGGNDVAQRTTGIDHISTQGNEIWVHYSSGDIIRSVKASANIWRPTSGSTYPSTGQDSLPSTGDRTYDPATSEQMKSILDFAISREGTLAYSQGPDRLSWVDGGSGYSDCSGFVWGCYNHILGVDIGTYTLAQVDNMAAFDRVYSGAYPPDESVMRSGDLIYYSFPSISSYGYDGHTVDHVEFYLGNSKTLGLRGSTSNEPNEQSFDFFGGGFCDHCWVNRYKEKS